MAPIESAAIETSPNAVYEIMKQGLGDGGDVHYEELDANTGAYEIPSLPKTSSIDAEVTYEVIPLPPSHEPQKTVEMAVYDVPSPSPSRQPR